MAVCAEGASQGEATRSSIDTASPDAPSLLRPSLQKIVTELSGYSKHKKVSEDVGALVERLDVLLVTVGGPGTGRGPARGAGGGLSSPKAFRDSMRVAPVKQSCSGHIVATQCGVQHWASIVCGLAYGMAAMVWASRMAVIGWVSYLVVLPGLSYTWQWLHGWALCMATVSLVGSHIWHS